MGGGKIGEDRSGTLTVRPIVSGFCTDLRQSWRVLARARGSALAVIALVGLGMAGVLALFGPLYSAVFAPLPFPHSEQLVRIGRGVPVFQRDTDELIRPEYMRRVFSGVTAYASDPGPMDAGLIERDARPSMANTTDVMPNFFDTLGVRPWMGHDFPRKGGHPWDVGAILNYEFWRDQLGGSQKVIGQRSLRLGGENVLVLGVMPPGFDFPPGTDIWLPDTDGDVVVGRLRPRLSLAEAATALRGLGHKPSQAARRDAGPVVESLHSFLVGGRDWLLLTLWGVSFLFLLLACAGAANILLARGVKRRSEMVVRVTLGAGRPRLIRQLLAETLVLAAAGGLLGLGLAWACNRWIALLLPATQRFAPFPPTEIGLIVALTLAATLLCGLAPAFHATGGDLNRFLKAGTSGTTSPSAPRRFLSAHELLASGQLAVAMILLISTGLLLRSMVEHLRVPLGFRAKNVFVVETHLMELPEVAAAEASYFDTHPMKGAGSEYDRRMYQAIGPTIDKGLAQSATFYDEALRKLAALPGVESVAVMSPPPFGGVFSPRGYAIEARDAGHVREGDAFHIWAGAN